MGQVAFVVTITAIVGLAAGVLGTARRHGWI
jgi:hypothetical protein